MYTLISVLTQLIVFSPCLYLTSVLHNSGVDPIRQTERRSVPHRIAIYLLCVRHFTKLSIGHFFADIILFISVSYLTKSSECTLFICHRMTLLSLMEIIQFQIAIFKVQTNRILISVLIFGSITRGFSSYHYTKRVMQ